MFQFPYKNSFLNCRGVDTTLMCARNSDYGLKSLKRHNLKIGILLGVVDRFAKRSLGAMSNVHIYLACGMASKLYVENNAWLSPCTSLSRPAGCKQHIQNIMHASKLELCKPHHTLMLGKCKMPQKAMNTHMNCK